MCSAEYGLYINSPNNKTMIISDGMEISIMNITANGEISIRKVISFYYQLSWAYNNR